MEGTSKLKKLLTTSRHQSEIEDWMFSLVPIGVAFTFYILFIMSTDIEPKSVFLAYGAAAGFIGLESYWITRGWRKNHATTIIMGLIGIAITLSLLFLYVSIVPIV
jgi:RsiW-degrading membrane proteinase PrsW (M82 family)